MSLFRDYRISSNCEEFSVLFQDFAVCPLHLVAPSVLVPLTGWKLNLLFRNVVIQWQAAQETKDIPSS